MYYSSAQSPKLFYDRALESPSEPPSSTSKRKRYKWAGLGLAVLIGVGAAGWYGVQIQHGDTQTPATLGQTTAGPTPTPSPAVTFGDLLEKKLSYAGWLAGVEQGNIVLSQGTGGASQTIVSVASPWYGPISPLYWSPDHSKLAYLTLPAPDAAALTRDPAGFAAQIGLGNIPQPNAFPFGRVTILDVATKQVHQTTLEVRNTPKPLVWLDDTSLAALSSTLVRYQVTDRSVTTLAGGGNTNAKEQLQSPLVWDKGRRLLYFTIVRQQDQDQAVRLVMSLNLDTNQLNELHLLRRGPFSLVTTSQGIDLALSHDGARLAMTGDQGLQYMTVSDQGMHDLPYKEEWLWLERSVLGGLQWLSPDRLGFTSLSPDGERVWGVWHIPTDTITTFGRGSLAGSWDVASGRLALALPEKLGVQLVTPNWDDPLNSRLETLALQWTDIAW